MPFSVNVDPITRRRDAKILIAFSAALLFHDTPLCDKNVNSLVSPIIRRD